jgi:hypothetical protein
MRVRIAVSSLLILFVGCIAAGRVNTPSGKPEVTFNRPIKQVRDHIVRTVSSDGMVVSHSDEYKIVATYNGADLPSRMILGDYDVEDHYTITPIDADYTKVYLARRYIMKSENPGRPGPFTTDQKQYDDMMARLLHLFATL